MTLMISVSGVRGIVGTLFNPEVVGSWAAAFSEILPPGAVVVGRDSRASGRALADAAVAIFNGMGREVLDVGVVPTPTVQLAVETWDAAGGLILSASHNPVEWNALKFVDHGGSFLAPDRFEALCLSREEGASHPVGGAAYGDRLDRNEEALSMHREVVLALVDPGAIRAADLRVTLECGHGAGGTLLPAVAEALGIRLDLRHPEPNGQLLAHPEPTVDSLSSILNSVDKRTAFVAMVDPDADRLGLALPGTMVLGEEWTLPLAVRHRLTTGTGPLVTNLSTSTRLESAGRRFGVETYRTSVGEAHVVGEMRSRSALIGGEGNGGVIDPRAHLGRDAAVAFALLCEAEAVHPGGLRALAEEFPARYMLKEKLELPKDKGDGFEEKLENVFGPAEDRRDGLRWAFPEGFLHVRASNTEPILRIVTETADENESRTTLERVRDALGG